MHLLQRTYYNVRFLLRDETQYQCSPVEGRLCSAIALRVVWGRCVFMSSRMLSTQSSIDVASLLTQATPIIP
jgi:hypothetical protein